MDLQATAITLQMANYFNRANKVNHPSLRASIIGGLLRIVTEWIESVVNKDGVYYLTNAQKVFNTYSDLEAYVKHFIATNFSKILTMAKKEPMLFIR